MKPKSALRSFPTAAGNSLLAIPYSHATPIAWDGGLGTSSAVCSKWTDYRVSYPYG